MSTSDSQPLNVVVALDSFKGSISAAAAVEAFSAGWRSAAGSANLIPHPMADGGEGTLDAFEASVAGARRMPVTVQGPAGSDVSSYWLLLPDSTGVVELGLTSGIELLGERREPWSADTRGLGEALAAALAHGVERLIVGIGSSASTDAGAGMLQALGARILDEAGAPISSGLAGLREAVTVDLTSLTPPPRGGVIVLSDVTNPLCGAHGAAAVFGAQKGLKPEEVDEADGILRRFADMMRLTPDTPGAGAAGGAGYALAAWGAQLTPGAYEIAELVGLRRAITHADVVVTGEGSFDGQSAAGKVPSYVAGVAQERGVPVVLVAGRVASDAPTSSFARTISLTVLAGGTAGALADPAHWLREAGQLAAAPYV